MAAELPFFTQEEMAVDEFLGFPKAYARLCRSPAISPFANGPPFTFIPYSLPSQEFLRMRELNQMFPIIDPDACFSADPRGYVELLWEQLDHLGNAGFDPALFRVDPFGNVLYLNADSASPLAWDIDHWFPCSRGGKTLHSNLRILQWQLCRKKKNRLDFLIPWWDLQLGITVNQFLLVFASRNSDFTSRAFSLLFPNGEGEEFNALQNVKTYNFPQKFMEVKRKLGLAPAAIVSLQNKLDEQVLKAADLNISLRHNSPRPAARKSLNKEDATDQFRASISKENYRPAVENNEYNPYLTISLVREQRREINQLDEELNKLKKKNDTERVELLELEAVLIRRRRRVDKCRRLSEAQASYRSLLEKMIRDAMHQIVVYKEQLRQNQAASSALMARLETQRTICDSSENELRRIYKKRHELEIVASAHCEQAGKRSGIQDAYLDALHDKGSIFVSSTRRVRKSTTRKELRVFLEEEQKASEAGISLSFNDEEDETTNTVHEDDDLNECVLTKEPHCRKSSSLLGKKSPFPPQQLEEDGRVQSSAGKLKDDISRRLKGQALGEGTNNDHRNQISYPCSPSSYSVEQEVTGLINTKKSMACREEEDEEYRNQVGKGHVEKWLQVLLENAEEGSSSSTCSPPTPSNSEKRENSSNTMHKEEHK